MGGSQGHYKVGDIVNGRKITRYSHRKQVENKSPSSKRKYYYQHHWYWQCPECGQEFGPTASGHLSRGKGPCQQCSLVGPANPRWGGYEEMFGSWLKTMEKDAYKRGYCWEVTYEQLWELYLKQGRKCVYTGFPISMGKGKWKTASLDRRDNRKGYTIDNVQWIHKHVNIMKRDHDEGWFLMMILAIADNHVKTKPHITVDLHAPSSIS